MTEQTHEVDAGQGPEGSLFLFNELSEHDYREQYFALLLGRGVFRGMSYEEQDAAHRELELRLAITLKKPQ